MCKGLAHKIYETYKVVINIRDISTWVYAGMYDGGKWTRFSTYRGDQSIFAWTATCASQIVFKELDKQHLIPPSSDLNATNTSLTLKSMQNVEEIKMVIDLVDVPELHSVLTMIYVKRMTDEQIMAETGMSKPLLRKTVRTAETMLKEALIDKESMLVVREDGKIVNLVRKLSAIAAACFRPAPQTTQWRLPRSSFIQIMKKMSCTFCKANSALVCHFSSNGSCLLLTAPKRCLGLRRNRPSFMSAFTIMRIL